jgi:hypothetical protein
LIRDLGEYGTIVSASHSELTTAAPAGLEGPFSATVDNSSVSVFNGAAHTQQENT